MLQRVFAFILLCRVLAACAPAPAPAPTATATRFVITPFPTSTPDNSFGGCASVAPKPTPKPGNSLFAPPGEGQNEHLLGPKEAAAVIVVYQDFQQPASASVAEWLGRLREEYPDDLRIVFRHYPMTDLHNKAALAARAAEAAHLQGRFWEMHDQLFTSQDEWRDVDVEVFERKLVDMAAILGLDVVQFKQDLTDPAIIRISDQAWQEAKKIQIPLAPFVLINGQIYSGPTDYTTLKFIVSLLALGERQYNTCPPLVIDVEKEYFAVLKTAHGDVRIRLYTRQTPFAVNNFVFLAREGWYKNITFHRVVAGYVAQTGDPSGSGTGNPGYYIKDELLPTLKFDRPGLVGMASVGPNTNGSQFFITLAPLPDLDGVYTLFGEVVSGLGIIEKLTPREAEFGKEIPTGDALLDVIIEER